LFVAALGNNTVEVVDLNAGRRIQSIKELHEPGGVLVVPKRNRIYVANGEDGKLTIFRGHVVQTTSHYRFFGRCRQHSLRS
jgi:DNA-binding beta-propeller fold protein YncE